MATIQPAYLGRGKFIFISYAHADKDLVYPFIAALQKNYNVWYDQGLGYKTEWTSQIADRLLTSHIVLFLVTKNSLESTNCQDEIHFARDKKKNIINILFDPTLELPDNFMFRYGRYQMCKVFEFNSYDDAVRDLSMKCDWFVETSNAGEAPSAPSTLASGPSVAPCPSVPTMSSSMGNKYAAHQVGDIIEFGKYDQDSFDQPIAWKVVDRDEESLLLISVKILASERFHDEKGECDWEGCSLRRWLNGEFYDTAFSAEEKVYIKESKVAPSHNAKYNIRGHREVMDKVFIFGIEDIEKYFPKEEDRIAEYTRASKEKSAAIFATTGWYWLRSPGCDRKNGAGVKKNGKFDLFGYGYKIDNGVRPVIRIRTK